MSNRPEKTDGADKILFRTRLHPISCLSSGLLAVLLLTITGLILRHNQLSASTILWVRVGGVALAAASLVGPLLRLWRSRVLLTPDRLVVRISALLSKPRVAELSTITRVDVHRTWLGGFLGYGTLVLTGQADHQAVLRNLSGAERLRAAIERQCRGGRRR